MYDEWWLIYGDKLLGPYPSQVLAESSGHSLNDDDRSICSLWVTERLLEDEFKFLAQCPRLKSGPYRTHVTREPRGVWKILPSDDSAASLSPVERLSPEELQELNELIYQFLAERGVIQEGRTLRFHSYLTVV